jgi:hypothetical protein
MTGRGRGSGATGRVRSLASLLLMIALAACGESTLPPAIPEVTLSTDLSFSCGGITFPAEALAAQGGAETTDTPAAAALRRYLRGGEPVVEELPLSGYRILWAEAQRVVFATGPDRAPIVAIEATADGGRWTARGRGICAPALVIPPGLNAATWRLPAGAPMPDAATTRVDAMVTELECTSGRPAAERVLAPVIRREPTRVLVVYAVREPPPSLAETCPAAPPTKVTLDLGQPLGRRELLDGGVFPPGSVWSPDCCG